MRRADRLFELVQFLRGRRLTTAQELSEKLEVSVRTIYRDIRDLQSRGVPIVGEAGVGYVLLKGYELPPLTFTIEELEALVLGARFVSAWSDPSLAIATRRILGKIESVLPDTLKGVMDSTPIFAHPIPRPPPRYLEQVRRAVSEKRQIHFAYTREDQTQSERSVCPLGLYFWGKVWVLATWCSLREDYRSFRVDRMENVILLETFEEDECLSLTAFLSVVYRENRP